MPQATLDVVNNGLTLGSAGLQFAHHMHHSSCMDWAATNCVPSTLIISKPTATASVPRCYQHISALEVTLDRYESSECVTVLSRRWLRAMPLWIVSISICLPWEILCHCALEMEKDGGGKVFPPPWPKSCTLTQFVFGSLYLSEWDKDIYGCFGLLYDPQSTDVIIFPGTVKPWSLPSSFRSSIFESCFHLVHDSHCKYTLCKISWTDVCIHYICLQPEVK